MPRYLSIIVIRKKRMHSPPAFRGAFEIYMSVFSTFNVLFQRKYASAFNSHPNILFFRVNAILLHLFLRIYSLKTQRKTTFEKKFSAMEFEWNSKPVLLALCRSISARDMNGYSTYKYMLSSMSGGTLVKQICRYPIFYYTIEQYNYHTSVLDRHTNHIISYAPESRCLPPPPSCEIGGML